MGWEFGTPVKIPRAWVRVSPLLLTQFPAKAHTGRWHALFQVFESLPFRWAMQTEFQTHGFSLTQLPLGSESVDEWFLSVSLSSPSKQNENI